MPSMIVTQILYVSISLKVSRGGGLLLHLRLFSRLYPKNGFLSNYAAEGCPNHISRKFRNFDRLRIFKKSFLIFERNFKNDTTLITIQLGEKTQLTKVVSALKRFGDPVQAR